MRTWDRPVPGATGERPGPASPMAGWPIELYIGIERIPPGVAAWDTNEAGDEWDVTTDQWDQLPPDFRMDATCDFQGLEIVTGTPDPEGRISSGEVNLTLANRHGEWSQYDETGKLVSYGPGAAIDIWVVFKVDPDEPFWLFSGKVTSWHENTVDKTVEVQAFDHLNDLNIDIGEWDPGIYFDDVPTRLLRILALLDDTTPRRFDTGRVTLHSFFTTATPLEEIQNVAMSDGGLFFAEVDGTLVHRDRDWPGGRDDQNRVLIFSDNVCDDDIVNVWDPAIRTDDVTIVNEATLTNVAGITVTADDSDSIDRYGFHPMEARDKDQWITEAHGQELADYIVARRADAYFRVDTFTLYLHKPRPDLQLWLYGVDMRLGDIIRFPHDEPTISGPGRIDLNLVVHSITHSITPGSWVVNFGTTRAVGDNVINQWDTALTWDNTPAAMWS